MNIYFDESGIHEGAKICAVAGYFGQRNAWEKLETDWRHALEEFHLPEFHARRFWARDGDGHRVRPYDDLDDVKAQRFFHRLLRAIKDSHIYPVGAAVVGEEWKQLDPGERRFLTGGRVEHGKFTTSGSPNKAYFLPFLQVVYRVTAYCSEGEKADFFFGLDRTFSGYARDYFKQIKKLNQPMVFHLGEIHFPVNLETKPLQAADLLAYEVYQYAKRRLVNPSYSGNSQKELLAALARLRNVQDDFKIFDRRGLQLALEKFRRQNPQLCS
jgi:hypothetical protein